jgi:hypothetical protein
MTLEETKGYEWTWCKGGLPEMKKEPENLKSVVSKLTGNGKRQNAHLRHYLRSVGVGASAGRTDWFRFAFFPFGNDNLGLP